MSLYGGLQTGMLQAKTETAVGIVVFYMQQTQNKNISISFERR